MLAVAVISEIQKLKRGVPMGTTQLARLPFRLIANY
jgi:hypothetical protein